MFKTQVEPRAVYVLVVSWQSFELFDVQSYG